MLISSVQDQKQMQMKKVLREMQTLRAGCSRWNQKFSPRRRPPSQGHMMAKI